MRTTEAAPLRASALLDIPSDLDPMEHRAYVRGYAASCMRYAKRHGIPSTSPSDVAVRIRSGNPSLRDLTIEYEWARHPAAHRAGLLAIKKHRAAEGERLRIQSRMSVAA